MDEIFIKLLEQTPVIIALGIGIYALWKDKQETKAEQITERATFAESIQKLNDKHAEELKQLNEYIRGRDLETLEALEQVTAAVENIKNQLDNKLKLLD